MSTKDMTALTDMAEMGKHLFAECQSHTVVSRWHKIKFQYNYPMKQEEMHIVSGTIVEHYWCD